MHPFAVIFPFNDAVLEAWGRLCSPDRAEEGNSHVTSPAKVDVKVAMMSLSITDFILNRATFIFCMTVDMQTYPLSHFMAAHQAFNGRRFPDACRDHLPSSCGIPAVSSFLEMMKGKRRRWWWRQLLLTEQSGMAAVTPGHSPGVRYPIWSLATAELGAEVGHPVKSTGALI